MIDFIGIGAQRTGTSWTYACLYEHPEICAPIKEIHFFSRDRFSNGTTWYEDHFKKCGKNMVCGEFSTSYLYTPITAKRIHDCYPDVKIIAILRNPIDRAFSHYGNAIKGGEIPESRSFEAYYTAEKSVLEQGLYALQLKQYFTYFDRSRMLILIHEDAKKDPLAFIQSIYAFLGVDAQFVPSMLTDAINVSRVPKHIFIEKLMHRFSEFLRKHGLDQLVHAIRRVGLPELVRLYNTKPKERKNPEIDREQLTRYFHDDVQELSTLLGRDMVHEWGIIKQIS